MPGMRRAPQESRDMPEKMPAILHVTVMKLYATVGENTMQGMCRTAQGRRCRRCRGPSGQPPPGTSAFAAGGFVAVSPSTASQTGTLRVSGEGVELSSQPQVYRLGIRCLRPSGRSSASSAESRD